MVYEDVTDQAPCFPFYFRQVLAGPHENFHYVFGDPVTKEAVAVDPTFELEHLFSIVERDGYRLTRAVFTHGHWDHMGAAGELPGLGVTDIHVHEAGRHLQPLDGAVKAGATIQWAADGDPIAVGDLEVTWLHTPGHQPEASCILVAGDGAPRALFTGDTLFIDTCGRTDFPGGDTAAMFASMQRLRGLAKDDLIVMPGHHYADRTHEDLATQLRKNPALHAERADFEALACLTN